jgi:hypothetical protein
VISGRPLLLRPGRAPWRALAEAVKELQGGETHGGPAGGIGLRQEVEDLVGPVADQVEAVEGEGRRITRPNEPPGSYSSGTGTSTTARGHTSDTSS